MIGLVDYNLQVSNSVHLAPPNLEIMKLAAYYKTEKNQFCRLVDLEEQELDSYDKIFFFSEDNIDVSIPPAFQRISNIEYGGTNFTNGEYVPFEDSIIDFTLPRTDIYKSFLKDKYNDGIKTSIISQFLDNSYYRMMAGKEKLPIPPMNRRKKIYIYDKNIFCDGWEEIFSEIVARGPSSITCIHPIICTTLSQYFKIRSYEKMSRTNNYILDLDIPLKETHYMLKNYKHLFLADVMKTSNVAIGLGGSFSSNFQYYKDLIYKLNLLYSFWSQGINIKIYYIKPKIGFSDPIANLSQRIVNWSYDGKEKKSINERIVFKSKKEKSEAHKERDLILKFYPNAKDLFDQTYTSISERGVWRI